MARLTHRIDMTQSPPKVEILLDGKKIGEVENKDWHEFLTDGVSSLRWWLPHPDGTRALRS